MGQLPEQKSNAHAVPMPSTLAVSSEFPLESSSNSAFYNEDEARWMTQQPAPAPPLSLHVELEDLQRIAKLAERKSMYPSLNNQQGQQGRQQHKRQVSNNLEWLTFIKGDVNNDDQLPEQDQQRPEVSAFSWASSGDFLESPTPVSVPLTARSSDGFNSFHHHHQATEASPSIRSVLSDSSADSDFLGGDADMDFALPPAFASPSSSSSVSASASSSSSSSSSSSGMSPPRLKRKISMLQNMDFFKSDPLNFNVDSNMADLERDLSKNFPSDDDENSTVAAATESWLPGPAVPGGIDFDQVEMGDENLAALPYLPARPPRPAFISSAASALLPRIPSSTATSTPAVSGKAESHALITQTPTTPRTAMPPSHEALVLAQQYPVTRLPFASFSDSNGDDDSVVDLGTYTRAQRRQVLERYHAKMATRKKVAKVVKYPGRKLFAEARPRIGGRFVKLPAGFHKKFKKENN